MSLEPSTISDVCGICRQDFSRYKCPRCNILYCTKLCYNSISHSFCSESFYKESFCDELKGKKVSYQEKLKILSILKKLHEEDDNLLDSTLEDADLSESTLSHEEALHRSLQNGNVSDFFEIWVPWWRRASEFSSKGLVPDFSPTTIPKICPDIPILASLIGNSLSSSPTIWFNIISILFSYCSVSQLYNGPFSQPFDSTPNDQIEFVEEALCFLLHYSPELNAKKHNNFFSLDEVVAFVLEPKPCEREFLNSSSVSSSNSKSNNLASSSSNAIFFKLQTLKDVSMILSQRNYTLASFSNIHTVLSYFVTLPHSTIPKRDLRLALKKTEFFMSWAADKFPIESMALHFPGEEDKFCWSSHLKSLEKKIQELDDFFQFSLDDPKNDSF